MKRVLINELKENEETRISGFASKIRDTKYGGKQVNINNVEKLNEIVNFGNAQALAV